VANPTKLWNENSIYTQALAFYTTLMLVGKCRMNGCKVIRLISWNIGNMSGNMGGDNDIEEEKDKGLFFYKKPD